MASQLTARPSRRSGRGAGSRWAFLRVALAMALAFLMLPVLGAGASAEEADPPPEELVSEVLGDQSAEEPAEENEVPEEEQAPPAEEGTPDDESSDPALEAETAVDPTLEAEDEASALAAAEVEALVDVAATCNVEIDGNFSRDGTEPNQDWTTMGLQPIATDDVGNPDGSIFTEGSKELAPDGWTTASGNPGVNTDISHVYAYSKLCADGGADDGDAMAYFAFERNANNGTTFFTLELNRKPNKILANGVSVPDRSTGDLALAVSQQGQGTWDVSATAYTWDSAAGEWVEADTQSDWFVGASNQTTIDNTLGASVVAGRFAEFSVNLSKIFPSTCVASYGALNLRSRASEPITAALKDFVEPVTIAVQGTCAELRIEKRDETTDELVGGASYSVAPDPTPGSNATALELVDGGLNDPDGAADGTIHLAQVTPGVEYTVTETAAPPGYLLPPEPERVQQDTATENATVSFAFSDPRRWEPLTVEKTAEGYYDVDYTWTIDKSVDRDEAAIASGTAPFGYTVAVEQLAESRSNYRVEGVVTVSNPNEPPVEVELSDSLDGENATCEFEGGSQVSVPADGDDGLGTAYAYTCTFDGDPEDLDGGTNTATITWDKSDYPQSQDDVGAEGTYTAGPALADYTFEAAGETNKTISVTDSLYEGWDSEPWQITWGEEEDGVYVQTYTLEHGSEPGTCMPYANTAKLLGADGEPLTHADGRPISDSATVEVCMGADLAITKSASLVYERTYLWKLEKTGPGTVVVGETVDPVTGKKSYSASVDYSVTVTPDRYDDSGQTLVGTITLTNPNDWQDITATVTDEVSLAGVTCEIDETETQVDAEPANAGFQVVVPQLEYDDGTPISGSNKVELSYTCSGMVKDQYDGTNTATATWDQETYATPGFKVSDEVPIEVAAPSQGANETITVLDPMAPEGTFEEWNWHEGEKAFDYTAVLTTDAGQCTDHPNTATIEETGQTDTVTTTVCAPSVSKTVDATYDLRYPWTIEKDVVGAERQVVVEDGKATFSYLVLATPGRPTAEGHDVRGTITIHNPEGSEDLTVDVADEIGIDGATCRVQDGDDVASGATVAAGESVTLTYTCNLPTGFEVPEDKPTNTVVVSWGDEQVTDTADVVFELGEEIDKSVEIVDDKFTTLNPWKAHYAVDENGEPKPSQFPYKLSFGGVLGECTTVDNTATIQETKQSDSATVTVCVQDGLDVAKDGAGTFERTYHWTIDKFVDDERVETPAGTSVRPAYGVTVTPGGYTDSGWRLTGTITVENPNDPTGFPEGDLTATVTDLPGMGSGAACTVSHGPDQLPAEDVVIPAGDQMQFDYSCTFVQLPELSYVGGTNVATATWVDATGSTVTETGTARDIAFNLDKETDETIHVYDDKVTLPKGGEELLGTATYPHGETFSYDDVGLAGTAGECTPYTNTAFIEETGQSDAQTVTVCGGADLEIEKSAAVSYDREFTWSVEKTGPGTLVVGETVAEDGTTSYTTEVEYEVTVTPDDIVDSKQKLGGTITVTNPNDWQDIDATVTDEVSLDGVTCELAGTAGLEDADPASAGFQVTVPRREYDDEGALIAGSNQVELTYSCTGMASDSYTGTNTATVQWDETAYSTPTGRAEATVDIVDDGPGNTGLNEDVTLVDSMLPGEEFGPYNWYDLQAAPAVEKYRVILGTDAGACTPWENVASLEGTTASDDHTVTVCAPEVSKSADATFVRTYPWTVAKSVDKTRQVITPDGSARFEYEVVATPGEPVDSDYTLTGEITVSNPEGSSSLTVDVSDHVGIDGAECTVLDDDGERAGQLEVGPGATVVLDYECALPSGFEPPAEKALNHAVVSWGGNQVSAATEVAFGLSEEIDKSVEVTDSRYTPDEPWMAEFHRDPVTEKPVPVSFDYALEFPGSDIEPGECRTYDNTATITQTGAHSDRVDVEVCVEAEPVVTKTATGSFDRLYEWSLDKSVDSRRFDVAEGGKATPEYAVTVTPDGHQDSGWTVWGQISVTNPNTFGGGDILVTKVADIPGVGADAQCTITDDDRPFPAAGVTVPADGEVVLDYTCTFTDFAESEYDDATNTAVVTWRGVGDEVKTARGHDDFDFEVDEETDKTVEVFDDKVFAEGKGVALGTWSHDDGSHTFAYDDVDLAGTTGECTPYTNTATMFGTDGAQLAQDSETVTVCVEAGLTVTKTVQASYDLTHHWSIDKSVDATRVEVAGDGDATFRYTVKATPNGSSASGYRMAGTITVTNPNDADSFPDASIIATVTDQPAVGGGATCTVAGGQDVVLAPGASTTLGYTCSFTGTPSAGTNTATATWTGPGGQERSASTGAVPVAFTAGGGANSSVTVTDSMTSPSTLGTATWNAAGTPTTFTYSLTHQGAANACVDHTNTATITQTGQSDSQTVTVCSQGALVVTQAGAASLDRTYEWDIEKLADRTRLDTDGETPGTVNYTVGVSGTGFVDSGWEQTGSVTVHNPNGYQDVTVDIEVDRDGVASCGLTGTRDLLVPAGETRTFSYACSFSGQPSYDDATDVVVTWAGGRVEAGTVVPFTVDEEVDRTVTVTDDLLEPSGLGEVTWTGVGETTLFEYALPLEAAPNDCRTVTNTARIVETGQAAEADVLVCGPEILPTEEERPPAPPAQPRPPAVLPDTGAPAGAGIQTTLGGLMLAVGALLLVRRKRGVA